MDGDFSLGSAARPLSDKAARFLSGDKGLLIGDQELPALSGGTFETLDPATGQPIGRVARGGAADVERAVAAAEAAFAGAAWRGLSPRERGRLLSKVADHIALAADELAELEALDNGMPHASALGGVHGAAEAFRYYSGWCTKLVGQTYDPSQGEQQVLVYTRREPIGVVGLITPWNFPLIMAAMKLAPALAAGCACILKPAEQTPLTALRLVQIMLEAGLPPGVVNVVTGDAEAGAAMVAHPRIRKVAFTGSTAVGREIVRGAAGNLKRVSLELGGKSPFFILPDADLDQALPAAARGIFGNAGQNCVAASRLYVHHSLYDQAVESMVKAAGEVRVGPAFDPASTMGPLITAEHRQTVADYVAGGVGEGAEILCGGAEVGGRGFFYQPTVMVGAPVEARMMRDEIFGPVVAIDTFGEIEDIPALANRSEFRLAASVWTRDLSAAHRLAHRIDAGNIGVNIHGPGDFAVPLGGFKQSGWGRENGEPGLSLYLEQKSITVKLA